MLSKNKTISFILLPGSAEKVPQQSPYIALGHWSMTTSSSVCMWHQVFGMCRHLLLLEDFSNVFHTCKPYFIYFTVLFQCSVGFLSVWKTSGLSTVWRSWECGWMLVSCWKYSRLSWDCLESAEFGHSVLPPKCSCWMFRTVGSWGFTSVSESLLSRTMLSWSLIVKVLQGKSADADWPFSSCL